MRYQRVKRAVGLFEVGELLAEVAQGRSTETGPDLAEVDETA
jgi:hypothetical protein